MDTNNPLHRFNFWKIKGQESENSCIFGLGDFFNAKEKYNVADFIQRNVGTGWASINLLLSKVGHVFAIMRVNSVCDVPLESIFEIIIRNNEQSSLN